MASKHDLTGRDRRKMKSFIGLERYIFECAAHRSLSLAARAALLELGNLYNGSNNGRIALSALGLSKRIATGRATSGRALKELEAKGFIEPVRQGGFNIKSGEKRATEWRLTSERCNVTGNKPSRNFMRWHAGKIHFTVASQSNTGLTTEQPATAAQ